MTDYKEGIHPFCYTIAGATSGVICRAVGQPLDVLKIRFQLQDYKRGQLKYNNIITATRLISSQEGFLALWKGHVPAQGLSLIYGIVKFNSYEFTRDYLYKRYTSYSKHSDFKIAADFLCGGISGVAATFACQPIDVMRTRLIVQEKQTYRGIRHGAQLMLRENGFRTFYKGLVPTLSMIYPHVGLNFAFYGLFKRAWSQHGKLSLLLCGALSGVCSKIILLPFDMIKKRLQVTGFHGNTNYNGMYDCFCKLVKEQGVFVLYRGATPSLLKAAVVTGISFFTYEQSLSYCYKYQISK